MKRVLSIAICVLALSLITLLDVENAFAAVGCSLNDPDRDVKRIFPQSTGYKTMVTSVKEKGGEQLAKEIEKRLGDKLDPIFEAPDVPHSFYTVLMGKEVIGYVHGVNQKGTYGGMQIFLALDPRGKIVEFFYQRISSPEVKKFRDSKFTAQFKGLTLADFYNHDAMKEDAHPDDPIGKIKDPSDNNHKDFTATLRGIKMNLILSDKIMFNDKYDRFYLTQEAKM